MNRRYDELIAAFDEDPLTRSVNLESYCSGEFSMANVQANVIMEDQSQVEVAAHNALYLGVYDGHGGVEASLYILNTLFNNLLRFAQANQNQNANAITASNLRDAVLDTENGFLEYVKANYNRMRMIGKTGSCCLAGVIWKGTLHVANLGDSRAVIGYMDNNRIRAEQLTRDHNCNDQAIRAELMALHPDDPTIVLERNGGWRVKGIIMVSRSIGDTYLKRPEFSLHESFPRYEDVPEPFTRGVVSAEPEMHSRVLTSRDKFIIFASDGLWELLTNDHAAHIVHNNPRNGIAKRLLCTALNEAAARRGNITYRQMQTLVPGRESRRVLHDDISVIVVYLDNTSIFRKRIADLSYTGSSNLRRPSEFGRSGFNASPLSPRNLKASIKQWFKSSSSQNQSSTGETSQGLRVLGQSPRSHSSQNPNVRSRWKTLKQKFSSSSSRH